MRRNGPRHNDNLGASLWELQAALEHQCQRENHLYWLFPNDGAQGLQHVAVVLQLRSGVRPWAKTTNGMALPGLEDSLLPPVLLRVDAGATTMNESPSKSLTIKDRFHAETVYT